MPKPASRATANCASASWRDRGGSAGVGANGPDARECRRIAVTRCVNQLLRELALLFEVGWEGSDELGVDTDDLLQQGARVRIMG